MPTKTHPKGSIMKDTNKYDNNTSLVEAATINGKLVASLAVKGAGVVVGSFVSLADTASNHAIRNPEGHVAKALTTELATQYVDAKEFGYGITEKAKDIIDFTKLKKPVKTEEKTDENA